MKYSKDCEIDFSIVIPVYNCEKYITECIDSIANQKNVLFEIICIDDCSSDATIRMIELYQKKDARIILYKNNVNLGPASCRNIGIEKATGNWICFVDADDMLCENALLQIKNLMKHNQLDLLSFSGVPFSTESNFLKTIIPNEYMLNGKYDKVESGKELLAKLLDNGDRIRNAVFNCVKNSFIKDNSLRFCEGLRYADDNTFPFFINAKHLLYTNHCLYKRRYRTGSTVTSKKTNIHLDSFIRSLIDDFRTWSSIIKTTNDEINRSIKTYMNNKIMEIIRFDRENNYDPTKEPFTDGIIDFLYSYFIKQRPFFDSIIQACDLERIIKKKNIYIYGAKETAIMVSKILDYNDVLDYSFVVSYDCSGAVLRRKSVKCFYDVIKNIDFVGEDSLFIIAVSRKYCKEIEETLQMYNLDYCLANI